MRRANASGRCTSNFERNEETVSEEGETAENVQSEEEQSNNSRRLITQHKTAFVEQYFLGESALAIVCRARL